MSQMSPTLSQYLMSETHDLHMAFNENAFVNKIWKCTISKDVYAKYHSHLYFIYSTMESLSQDLSSKCNTNSHINNYFDVFYNTKEQRYLNRLERLETDLSYYYGNDWKSQISPSKTTIKYMNLIKDAAMNDKSGLRLIMHQFQRYLADLSGGQTLRAKLKKTFNLKNDNGVSFYIFDNSITNVSNNGEYVENYLSKLDKIGKNLNKDTWKVLLNECIMIYKINHQLYNEMTPNDKPTPFAESPVAAHASSNSSEEKSKTGMHERSFTLDELNKHDGVKKDRIYLSIDGSVFDVTEGKENYGPNGGYHLFAGHDITYCLAMNSLKKQDLDRLDVKSSQFDQAQIKRLQKWKDFFLTKYKLIGRLVNDNNINSLQALPNKVFKLEELHEYNGNNIKRNNLIYICVDGVIYDVTKGKEYYGINGGYNLFAGNDITYCLAINSLNKKDLNKFEFNLNKKQENALKKWKQFYQKNYKIVGKLNKFYWRNAQNDDKANIHSNL